MTGLKSEEIINAIRARLYQIAPDTTVYKTSQTRPVYPHFFVHQIGATDDEKRKNHHLLTFSFDIRYRIASDPSTDLKTDQKLDEMALKLFVGFTVIDCNDIKIRCGNKNYEKVDGVLHFFFDVKTQVLLVNMNENIPKQQKLGVEIGVKNG